jgi:hypothetical protein
MTSTEVDEVFPEVKRYLVETGLVSNSKRGVAERLQRILGLGKTLAAGLDLPPATIERQSELLKFEFPADALKRREIADEIAAARKAVDAHRNEMCNSESQRRFALKVLHGLDVTNKGIKDGFFFAGHFVFAPEPKRMTWTWSISVHHPVVSDIPADAEYAKCAYHASNRLVDAMTQPVDEFANKLSLAYTIARHLNRDRSRDGGLIPIADIASVFKFTNQESSFWLGNGIQKFKDFHESTFIVNLINLHRTRKSTDIGFELVGATIDQTMGAHAKPFYIPTNSEGTQTRPYAYMRMVDYQGSAK